MPTIRRLLLTSTLALLVACSDGGDNGGAEVRPALQLTFSDAPIDLAGISADFAADVVYGSKERNVFDVYLPDCDGPLPLVIYIHGGGFTGGDKSSVRDSLVREFLQSCVAHASINYTLLKVPDSDEDIASAVSQGGVLTSLEDTARALQFMRYHFASLNIDPQNVALYGGSAGAGASLWLGTHDDMADPQNADPVLRESTRVKAVGLLATQATYDLLRWEEVLLPVTQPLANLLGGTDVPTLAAAVGATNYLLTFLGVDSLEAITSEENAAYRANIDMLGLMDAGDAPIYVQNYATGLDDPLNLFLHHGLHAIAVKNRADEVGVASVAYSEDTAFPLTDPSGETLAPFLIRHIR
ncbi:MAG: alpha/beta hydrolase [Halioglobus sp.]|nr:alpha/beta hydrolase [Halioglobus sp.]